MADPNRDDLVAHYARLLSLAVHELRTPASVVTGYLRMLQQDNDPPRSPRQQKMITESERSCGRIVSLIAELSEVSKLDDGSVVVRPERFDLFDVLPSVAAGVHEADDRQVRLELRGEGNGAPMQGDLLRLRTAFAALFRAVLREQADAATVVADRRLGHADHDGTRNATVVITEAGRLEHVIAATPAPFDEFRGGLGMLLPIARRVIERHGGRIQSVGAPGPTTAIVVSLPVL